MNIVSQVIAFFKRIFRSQKAIKSNLTPTIRIDPKLLERLKKEERTSCSAEELSAAISEEDAVKIQLAMYAAYCDAAGSAIMALEDEDVVHLHIKFSFPDIGLDYLRKSRKGTDIARQELKAEFVVAEKKRIEREDKYVLNPVDHFPEQTELEISRLNFLSEQQKDKPDAYEGVVVWTYTKDPLRQSYADVIKPDGTREEGKPE